MSPARFDSFAPMSSGTQGAIGRHPLIHSFGWRGSASSDRFFLLLFFFLDFFLSSFRTLEAYAVRFSTT